MPATRERARRPSRAAASNLEPLDLAPAPDAPAEVVADKSYHGREVIKRLDGGPWTTRIAEPGRRGVLCWHRDANAGRAVHNNRAVQEPASSPAHA